MFRRAIAKTINKDAIQEPIRRVPLVVALNGNRLKIAKIEALEGDEVPRIPFHPSRCFAADGSYQRCIDSFTGRAERSCETKGHVAIGASLVLVSRVYL